MSAVERSLPINRSLARRSWMTRNVAAGEWPVAAWNMRVSPSRDMDTSIGRGAVAPQARRQRCARLGSHHRITRRFQIMHRLIITAVAGLLVAVPLIAENHQSRFELTEEFIRSWSAEPVRNVEAR